MESNKSIRVITTVSADETRFQFPRWANYLVPTAILLAIGILTYLPLLWSVGFSAQTTSVGYEPVQPLPFSHKVHAGDLQIDCRYCHTTVERAAYAAIPATEVCMNCHAAIKSDSDLLKNVRDSYGSGTPIHWIKVHDLPDFVFFDHSAHVNRGVGCVSCHGRVDQMEVVHQSAPLSMGWCLECHRQPEARLRPREAVTDMEWSAADEDLSAKGLGQQLMQDYHIRSPEFMTSCSVCHR
ncbi:MAG: cytochrome c3 family protein [Pirellulaceae bacterium]|nr:cytochrome c3 family protein [Pirellulaceae bacterium]